MNKFSFMKVAPIAFAVSGIAVIASVALISMFGLKLGLDFTGGSLVEVQFTENMEIATVREVVGDGVVIPTRKNGFIVRTKQLTDKEKEELSQKLQTAGDFELVRAETTGSLISSALREKAAWAIGIAILFIVLFIAFAFRAASARVNSWRFSMTAIVALAHDTVIVVGIFALLGHVLGVEIDLLFVTALLTLLGFSVHDTIVVFDRMRENLAKHTKMKLAEIADMALRETLVRSINTSVTAIFMLIPLLLFASQIFWFVMALTIGIAVGTYSSIFVAVPLLVWWGDEKKK